MQQDAALQPAAAKKLQMNLKAYPRTLELRAKVPADESSRALPLIGRASENPTEGATVVEPVSS